MASCRDAKTRRIDGDPIDWISDLPANVIDRIMQRLPLCDAARVGVFSRKSRQIWMSLPCLTFDARFFKDVLKNKQLQVYEFYMYNTVNKILLSHNGPIHRFFLHIPNLNFLSCPDIGRLITFLSNNDVKQITLENYNCMILELPPQFFALELEILKLCHCIFTIPPTFTSFKNLTKLELVNTRIMGDSFTSFISSCLVLEKLILKGLGGVYHLAINAPNLKYLEVYGRYKTICLKGCVSLSSVTIGLLQNVAYAHPTATREDVATTTCDLVDFLSGSKVQKLNLEAYSFEFLAGPRLWGLLLLKTFKHLKILRLSNVDLTTRRFSVFCFVSLNESCPNMELTISFASPNMVSKYKFAYDYGNDKFLHLCSMHFLNVTRSDNELSVIGSLLATSPALETLCIQRSIHTDTNFVSWMSRRLRRQFKASKQVKIVYLSPTLRI